jgi:hypothetical protein
LHVKLLKIVLSYIGCRRGWRRPIENSQETENSSGHYPQQIKRGKVKRVYVVFLQQAKK